MEGVLSARKVFFLGVKGVMMSNMAIMFAQMGKEVCGSDTGESQITDDVVKKLKISVIDIDDDLPGDVDLLVYGAAHGGESNSQVKSAKAKGIATITQGALIADIIKLFPKSIAICGCHGKTGTSSLVAFALYSLGAKVSWLIGAPHFSGYNKTGNVVKYDGGRYSSDAEIFVFEADEYAVCPPSDKTPKLLLYHPTHIICTNIDFDHPDIYRDLAHVKNVFAEFFTHARYVYECHSDTIEGNKDGVYRCLHDFGYKRADVEKEMESYVGVSRRLDFYGEHGGVMIYDDYGHHPAEIEATILRLREIYPENRLIIAFQSHTQSRTLALKEGFVRSLALADVALIDAIFPSAREKKRSTDLTARDLEAMAHSEGHKNIKGFTTRNELVDFAKENLRKGDIFMTIGAGDIYKIIPQIIASLKH